MPCRRRKTLAIVLLGVCASCFLTGQTPIREAVVTTKDQRQLRGRVVSQTPETITLRIDGVDHPIPRSDIERIQITPIEQQYRRKRQLLKDDDLKGRKELALWLYDEQAYALAMTELTDLAKRYPDDEQIKGLLTATENRLKLAGADVAALKLDKDGLPAWRLNSEQINLIKVFEVDLSGRPAISISKKTIDAFLDRFGPEDPELRGQTNRRRFRGAKGDVQLQKMFELSSRLPAVRSLYKQVKVRRDPPAMQTFRTGIHRNYVLNYCGAAACHGGHDAGKFFLFRKNPNKIDTVYTNFFILHSYRSASKHDMVDRQNPRDSLLVQFGLPRADATSAHPDVRGWSARLRPSSNDRVAGAIVNWIRQLQPQRTGYMIDYTVPDPTQLSAVEPGAAAGGRAAAPGAVPTNKP